MKILLRSYLLWSYLLGIIILDVINLRDNTIKIDSAIFYVNNLEQSIDFYQNKLGFELEFQDGKRYASFIFEDGSKLGLINVKEVERDNPGHSAVKIGTNNAKADYNKYQDLGLKFYKPLTEESWATEFIVFDLDKNKLIFTERK